MRITCNFDDCIYFNKYCCECDDLEIYNLECALYESYREQPDYKKEFWRAMDARGDIKQPFRVKDHGKKIEMYGMRWYTQGNTNNGIDNCYFTEEKSGFGFPGSALVDAAKMEAAMEKIKALPDCKDLPIAEKVKGKYVLVEASENG